jgi:Putative zinc ribbon domain
MVQANGAFCQSCGMPLQRPEDFGTAAGGARVTEYCRYCYLDGAFINPAITLAAMIDLCTGILVRRGMPEGQARAMMRETLPKLKRWAGVGATV